MPRKGARPGYRQMTVHLINNLESDYEISTLAPSREYQVLKELGLAIEAQMGSIYPNEVIRIRMKNFVESCQKLLRCLAEAKAAKSKGLPRYRQAEAAAEHALRDFDEELRSFAACRDAYTYLDKYGEKGKATVRAYFFNDEARKSLYDFWNNEAEFEVEPEELEELSLPGEKRNEIIPEAPRKAPEEQRSTIREAPQPGNAVPGEKPEEEKPEEKEPKEEKPI